MFFFCILAIAFNFLALVNDENFVLFVFLSFYYLIVTLYLRLTIKSFIFLKIWKIFDSFKNIHWINIYVEFLNSAFFLYSKSLFKPLVNSKKLLLKNILNSIFFYFNNNNLYIYIKIEESFSRFLQLTKYLIKFLSKFINFDKYLIKYQRLIKL